MSDHPAHSPSSDTVRPALLINGAALHADLPPPGFALPTRHLVPPTEWRRPDYAASFEAEVARAPLDLHAHLRRIAFTNAIADDAALAGAVVDLWIALGPAGLALRQRVLADQRHHLPTPLAQLLTDHLASGIDARVAGHPIYAAVLGRPSAGGAPFLRPPAPRT